MARWPGGARCRTMIAFGIRFSSKDLFAQGKLFLGLFLGLFCILCTNWEFLVHFMFGNAFLDILKSE